MENRFSIPILFVTFNRLDVSLKTFQRIRDIKPKYLYLSSDGARKDHVGEEESIQLIRKQLIESIDWECQLKTLFHEQNLGCAKAVSTAITWMFEEQEYGIILEDDCLPQSSFFLFVKELLLKYQQDTRIGMISGFNPFPKCSELDSTYLFSTYKSCWGWATWKRAWTNLDFNLSWRDTTSCDSIMKRMGYLGKDVSDWNNKLKKIDKRLVNTWAWRWYFSLASQNQLCIFPSVSLISNIGFGKASTHTSGTAERGSTTNEEIIFPLIHPRYIVPNLSFDKLFYKKQNTVLRRLKNHLPVRFIHKVRKLFSI